MSKHEDDILQIKKYLAGELDARAMYELERRAQDDPFLQDALDGYESIAKPQDENLRELTQRLKDKTTEKHNRIIPMRFIAIAAGVLLFLFAGLFWLINQHNSPPQIQQVTKIAIPQEKKAADTLPSAAITKPDLAKLDLKPRHKTISARRVVTVSPNAEGDAAISSPVGNSDKVMEEAPAVAELKAKKDSIPLNEVVVMGYATKTNSALEGRVAGISIDTLKSKAIRGLVRDENGPLAGARVAIKGTTVNTLTDKDGYFSINTTPNNSVLDITAVGYTYKQVRIKKQDSLIVSMQPDKLAYNNIVQNALGVRKESPKAKMDISTNAYNSITGVVMDNANEPLPGAIVKIKGTNIFAQTNSNGKFSFQSVPVGAVLSITEIGYQTKEISTIDRKKSLEIALQPNNNALAEVVVTKAEPAKEQEYQSARPANNWNEFRKYIKENAQSPDGKTGVVKVSFIVNANNSLSDFKVIKGISAQTDSAAVELIRNGPAWLRNTDNRAETVRVRVKFEAKK